MRSASPSWATARGSAVRARREHADARHRRQVADQRRHRHVLQQRLPDLGRGQVLRLERLTRQAVLADERRRLTGRCRLLREDEALDHARQAVGLAAADDPLEQASVLVRDVERRVARAHATRRVGEPQEVAVRHAGPLAVLDRLVARARPPAARRTSARPRAAASGPSRGSPRRRGRTGTGACPCGPPAAARRAPRGASRRPLRPRLPRARTAPGRSSARGPPPRCERSRPPRAGRPHAPPRTACAFSRVSFHSEA